MSFAMWNARKAINNTWDRSDVSVSPIVNEPGRLRIIALGYRAPKSHDISMFAYL